VGRRRRDGVRAQGRVDRGRLAKVEDGTQGVVYIGQFPGAQVTYETAEPFGIYSSSLLDKDQGGPAEEFDLGPE
jgi:hypothetical protein